MKRYLFPLLLFCLLAALPLSASALTINIRKAVSRSAPVAVPSFGAGPAGQPAIAAIVRNDLRHSGYFSVVSPRLHPADPHVAAAVRLADWQKTGSLALAVGSTHSGASGYTVDADIISLISRQMVAGRRYLTDAGNYHMVGQQVADFVYKTFTGHPGPFASHLAYVDQQGNQYDLDIAQSDGWDTKTILRGKIPIISPNWSPHGIRMAYRVPSKSADITA